MKKVKIAFYGGCQFIPLVSLLHKYYADRVDLLDVGAHTGEKNLSDWRQTIFSPFNFLKLKNRPSSEPSELVDKLHTYLDAADIIVMQCFGKFQNLPIGRKYAYPEFCHKNLIARYQDNKKIIGANFMWFKLYFTESFHGTQLLNIIAFLYLKKRITSPEKIKKWLLEETAEELHTLFLKNLKDTVAINEKVKAMLVEDFSRYTPQFDFEDVYQKQLIASVPGHPAPPYYRKVLPQYLQLLFDCAPDEELIEENLLSITERLNRAKIFKLNDFKFFNTLFPELPSTEFENINAVALTENNIEIILKKIHEVEPENLQNLLSPWASFEA